MKGKAATTAATMTKAIENNNNNDNDNVQDQNSIFDDSKIRIRIAEAEIILDALRVAVEKCDFILGLTGHKN